MAGVGRLKRICKDAFRVTGLSDYLSVFLSTYLSIYLTIDLSNYLFFCLSANLKTKLFCETSYFSPPARWGLLDFIRAVLLILLLQFLLDHVCINSRVHFRLANSSPISSPTSARSGHRWTSTAGFRSECARLDLNRQVPSALDLNQGPSDPSGHRWTSPWDRPSSVGTAGPQPELSGHRWTSTAR